MLLILLNVRNAFNTTNWEVETSALERKGTCSYMQKLISLYLKKRVADTEGGKRNLYAEISQEFVLRLSSSSYKLAYNDALDKLKLVNLRYLC